LIEQLTCAELTYIRESLIDQIWGIVLADIAYIPLFQPRFVWAMRLHQQNVPHAGIAYIKQRRRTIGQIIMALVNLYHSHPAEYMHGRVECL